MADEFQRKKIVVVGSSNTDLIVRLPRLPAPGESVIGGNLMMAAGGKGANQAVAAARGGGRVALIARVGTDSYGKESVAGFRGERINLRGLVRDPKNPSGVALIFVSAQGENSIAVANGANDFLSPADVRRSASLIRSAGILVTQLEIPLETVAAALQLARENGIPTILNPAPARKVPRALLANVTYLTPNETECEILTGLKLRGDKRMIRRAAAILLAQGVQGVIITLGRRGAYVATATLSKFVPAHSVKAIDTTGAGDVFNGGLAVALLEGGPLLDAVRFASAAAALSVTRAGAQTSAPTRSAIRKFMNQLRAEKMVCRSPGRKINR